MGRYNFSADEIQRRAALSSELKKKSLAKRAAADAAAGGKPGAKKKDEKKQVAAAPKIDRAAIRLASSNRRNFVLGSAAFAGALTVTAGGLQRFMFPRVLFEPPSVFVAGRPDSYLLNTPTFIKEYRTWIIRMPDRVYALSGKCTHLGCTFAWLVSDSKFKCPCHGSGFRMTGVNFEGPAPRALERFKIWMAGSTMMVDTSKLYLYEKGDWEKPDTYVLV